MVEQKVARRMRVLAEANWGHIKAMFREMPWALSQASRLKHRQVLIDPSVQHECFATLDPRFFERVSAACTSDLTESSASFRVQRSPASKRRESAGRRFRRTRVLRHLPEGRTGSGPPAGKAGGSSPMKPELTGEALVRLVHRYYPAGMENYDPRYEDSEEAQRLRALVKAHVGGHRRGRTSSNGCAWSSPIVTSGTRRCPGITPVTTSGCPTRASS